MLRRRSRRTRIALLLALAASVGACASEAEGLPALTTSSTAPASTTTSTSERPASTTTSVAPAPTTTVAAAPVDVWALRPPAAADDPAGLAQQLGAAEAVLHDPAADEVAVATAALAQQVAYRRLGSRPEWDGAVLAALPAALADEVRTHVAARREFRAMHRTLPTTLPAWHIVAPAPFAELMAAYRDAEAAFGIPWRYLAAINLVETACGRIRGTSVAGAQGPMQFMPATWEAYGAGGDINDTHDAIMGAARYLAANNGAVDIDHALYRYNHSERYVRGVRLYADLIAAHPQGFRALYHWGVWYLTDQGSVYLPVGYEQTAPVPVTGYPTVP